MEEEYLEEYDENVIGELELEIYEQNQRIEQEFKKTIEKVTINNDFFFKKDLKQEQQQQKQQEQKQEQQKEYDLDSTELNEIFTLCIKLDATVCKKLTVVQIQEIFKTYSFMFSPPQIASHRIYCLHKTNEYYWLYIIFKKVKDGNFLNDYLKKIGFHVKNTLVKLGFSNIANASAPIVIDGNYPKPKAWCDTRNKWKSGQFPNSISKHLCLLWTPEIPMNQNQNNNNIKMELHYKNLLDEWIKLHFY